MDDWKWGRISEREALDVLVQIITKASESHPAAIVSSEEMNKPLRDFVKRKNPFFDDDHVERIVSNIRGWLGSRYTMLSKVSSDYVNVEKLLDFIEHFERSEEQPYGYKRRSKVKT